MIMGALLERNSKLQDTQPPKTGVSDAPHSVSSNTTREAIEMQIVRPVPAVIRDK